MPLEYIIEYTVREGAEDSAKAVRDRFFSGHRTQDTGHRTQDSSRMRYRSLVKPDGASFVHLAWFVDEDAFKAFQSLPEFPVFGQELKAACANGPDATAITEINSSVG